MFAARNLILVLWVLVLAWNTVEPAGVRRPNAAPKNPVKEPQPVASNSQTVETGDDDFLPYMGTRNDNFDWALSKKIVMDNLGSNTIISPISIKILLALLYEGASGSTFKQLETILELPVGVQAAREQIRKVLVSLQKKNDAYDLRLGTQLYLDTKFPVRQRYAAITQRFYDTMVEQIDFSNGPNAQNIVNTWVNKVTKGKVNGIVTAEDFENSVLLLLNAIYFKGTWRNPFPKNETHSGQFYVNSDVKVPVTYMSTTSKFFYYESNELDAKIIRLPYHGYKFAMYIFLPNSKNGLSQLISVLDPDIYKRHLWLMNERETQVVLPKFNFEFNSKMAGTLSNLGISELFQDSVSLPGIARGLEKNLVVSDVLQKAGIEVNEEGSLAFAASSIQIGNKFGDADYVFNASHPFLFLIEDELTGSILFFGKIENPLQTFGESRDIPRAPPRPVPASTGQVPQDINKFGEEESGDIFLSAPTVELDHTQQRAQFFDVELLQAVCSGQGGNVLVSPLSIKLALSMILEGASGRTAEELWSALRLPESPESSRKYIESVLTSLAQKVDGVAVEVSNRLFHSVKFTPAPNYKQIVQTYYGSDLQPINFADPVRASGIINEWVDQATHGTLKSIVQPNDISREMVVMVANALYFKGVWEKSFPLRDTQMRCFYTANDQCVQTPLMHITDNLQYASIKTLDAQVVNFPYKNFKYSLLVVVPNKRNGLYQLLRDLPHNPINTIIKELNVTEVSFSLPKFKLEHSQDLVMPLQHLQIRKLFTNKAELPGFGPSGLGIDSVYHKVSVEVSEEGTIAAAVSTAQIIPLMGSIIPQVRADHPFLIFIYDTLSNNVIFAGKIANPK